MGAAAAWVLVALLDFWLTFTALRHSRRLRATILDSLLPTARSPSANMGNLPHRTAAYNTLSVEGSPVSTPHAVSVQSPLNEHRLRRVLYPRRLYSQLLRSDLLTDLLPGTEGRDGGPSSGVPPQLEAAQVHPSAAYPIITSLPTL